MDALDKPGSGDSNVGDSSIVDSEIEAFLAGGNRPSAASAPPKDLRPNSSPESPFASSTGQTPGNPIENLIGNPSQAPRGTLSGMLAGIRTEQSQKERQAEERTEGGTTERGQGAELETEQLRDIRKEGMARRQEQSPLGKLRIWLEINKLKIVGFFLVVILVLVGVRFLTARGDGSGVSPVEVAPLLAENAVPSASAALQQEEPRERKAHIVGAVQNPGVYPFELGDRIQNLIDKAGGILPGAEPDILNLARLLADGEKICVPVKNDSESCASHQAASAAAPSVNKVQTKVNINLAGAAELDTLTGIGPALAQAIIDYRQANGLFSSLDELENVSGITETVINKFRDSATVG